MHKNKVCAILIYTVFLNFQVDGYEKTLRKIVRNQSKMVQRPFSENSGLHLSWKNLTKGQNSKGLIFPGYTQTKTVFHKMQRPKISTILSSVDTGRSKSTYTRMKISKNENMHPNDIRLARNTFANLSKNLQSSMDSLLFPEKDNNTRTDLVAIDNYYQIPVHSKFFPSIDERKPQNHEDKTIRNNGMGKSNHIEVQEKGLAITEPGKTTEIPKVPSVSSSRSKLNIVEYNDKADFILEGVPLEVKLYFNYNTTIDLSACTVMKETNADIVTHEKFSEFDNEPSWITKKHYWNSIYDARYESLMRNPKWPPLQVILIPRTHVDTIWRKPFDQYHNNAVSKIISNIVKKLTFYQNVTFTWNEISHLSQWWKKATQKSRMALRKLIKSGRFEITTGGWVEPDEATTHLFELVHQLIEGHQWLKSRLNYSPKIAWLTNTVTHSPTMTYLLSASDISQLVITNLHYSWEQYLAEYQYSDFIWVQNWDTDLSPSALNEALNRIGNDRFPKHSVLTHFLQFNSASFQACGPNKAICTTDFNFAKVNKNLDINNYNVKDKAELLLEQYSKTGTISSHNVIIAPLGGPYTYESQPEFDYQYGNYEKIADFVNVNREIYKATIKFGTPKDYFSSIIENQNTYQTLKGDFINFADIRSGAPAYWTGFFTSRPLSKILLRRLQSTLRSTEILFTFAISSNSLRDYNVSKIFELLVKARENVARLSDRNVASGTLSAKALRYAHSLTLATVKDCWYIQEIATSLLSVKPKQNVPYLQKYVYRDGEFISTFRTVSPGDQIYIFNSLSHERTELVELVTRYPNIRILDHDKKEITIQINPIWKYNHENYIKISRSYYKVIFVVVIPPMTLELYKIKETYDASLSAATVYCLWCVIEDVAGHGSIFPFNMQPLQAGDIQIESYKYRLIFDEQSGFLKTVTEKDSNKQKALVIDYGAFRDSAINSGMFLFNTNVTKPFHDILKDFKTGAKSKITMIISGSVSTELTSVFGRFLQQTTKIFNVMHGSLANAIFVETKVDYEESPKNRELELFLKIQTDINNGNPPIMYTDNNGFQYTARFLNISRRVESNMYPITSMAYIQDHRSRLTLVTDHAQGVTALQEGQLVIMLDRRVLYDDGRGTNEGLADSSSTCHRHIIILDNFVDNPNVYRDTTHKQLILPSLTATNLADSINYLLDIFIIDKNQSEFCHYAFLPLIKMPFPCDVSVLNYRIILKGAMSQNTPTSALMILHRQGVSCQIDYTRQYQCKGDGSFSLDRILSEVKAVHRTNLVGTRKGLPMLSYSKVTFPPMELMTLLIDF